MNVIKHVRLADCCEIVAGATPSTSEDSYWGGRIAWATPKDLSDLDSKYIDRTQQTLTERGYSSCSAKLMPAQSVLFSSRAPIGHVAINRVPMCTNQGFKSFVPDPDRISPDYLYYWLKANKPYLQSLGNGATFKEVSKAIVAEIKVPLISLPEQRRIAAILDKADALRTKRREAITKLDQLLQAVFLEMFGDPLTNPKGWPSATLSYLAREKMSNGIFRKKEGYSESGLPVVWVEDLFRGHELNLASSRKLIPTKKDITSYGLLPGDILFCRSSLKLDGIAYSNVYLGRANEALFECHLIRLRVMEDLVDPVFLNYLLRNEGVREEIKSRAKTSTMTTIDQRGLGDVRVVIPSLKLQKKFRTALDACALHLERLNGQLLSTNKLFESLQQRAFAGTL